MNFDNDIIEDPLFQLNLTLQLSMPSAKTAKIRPIFFENGWRIEAISPPIPSPPHCLAKAKAKDLTINLVSEPDVILTNKQNQYLTIELKTNSFSSSSSTSSQALTHLINKNNTISDALGKPASQKASSQLLYITSQNADLLHATLTELSATAIDISCNPNIFDVWELNNQPDGIYLITKQPKKDFWLSLVSPIQVIDTTKSAAQPLYLIPCDPSINSFKTDSYAKQVFDEQIRITISSMIITSVGKAPYDLLINDILREIIVVWDLWKSQNSKKYYQNYVRPYLKSIIEALTKNVSINVTSISGGWRFESIDQTTKKSLIRFFQSPKYRDGNFQEYSDQIEFDIESLLD